MTLCVCLDPGHGQSNRSSGRYDSGAVSDGFQEADFALSWALTLKFQFLAAGASVFLTRDDPTDPAPVASRDDRAEAAGADLLISLHCNTGGGTGIETFYRDARDKKLANIVQNAALAHLELRNRGLKTESGSQHTRLAVFDFDGPCCLLEMGFIDNKTDRAALGDRLRRIATCQAIVTGVMSEYGKDKK